VNFKVIWVVVTILGLIPVAALAAWLSMGSPGDQATAPEPEVVEPVAVQPPEPEFPNLTDGPRPPGQWEWSDLRGGECLRTFDSAFEETYDVVTCDGEHAAEFVRANVLDRSPDARYPGHAWVRREAAALCESWPLSDLNDGGRYDDLLVVPSYSLGEESWVQGDRLAGCFVYREGGLIDGRLVK
jgi:hypothetical protein